MEICDHILENVKEYSCILKSVLMSDETKLHISYLQTPWSRVLEKLTGFQLVKKFPAFYGTRKFVTVFRSAGHRSLSGSILSMPPSHFLKIHLNITLPSTLGSSKFALPFRFSRQIPVCPSPLTHTS